MIHEVINYYVFNLYGGFMDTFKKLNLIEKRKMAIEELVN